MGKGVLVSQSYRDFFSLSIIGALLILSAIKMGKLYQSSAAFSIEGLALLLTILALGITIYVLLQSKLQVKVGKKKVSVVISPLGLVKAKFKKKDIDDVSFFKTNSFVKSSGLFVHFGSDERVYNLGGYNGMTIQLRSGKKFTFFSSDFSEQQDKLRELGDYRSA